MVIHKQVQKEKNMKILGISGSTRNHEQSSVFSLVKTVLQATGIQYELVSLRGKNIGPCIACLGCVEDNICTQRDDMTEIREKFLQADAFVIGAPNFYSGINSITHATLERLYQFRHQEGNALWGKLAVAVGVGGSSGEVCCDQIETFMNYTFIETIAKVSGQGAACCYTCGHGETCKVGAVAMMHEPGYKIKDEDIPNITKQAEVMDSANQAGKLLGYRLKNGHNRKTITDKMQIKLMEIFKQST